ncbi:MULTISPECIES: carotenoid oxygenase family protein [Halolamina]|uniref:Carotenoid cleavage dioxygenase n=1 Tax=Halolamina pelagica TaxID=699431 RepID=A0A1I5THT3_9EURY|nr:MULTISPECIES: carotenoid oxygenase family protein [Halolamina]NHX37342.1 carotenoid oxygenase family protein [Halolamina sp. R1-12]SFP82217.1 Carotenoid cleavage dioxygenase [Halolamina pelagica]
MGGYEAGFRDLTEEHRDRDLPVEGSIPDWLDGALYRNGPARWSVGDAEADHWFDGLAHLTRFEFDDGGVRYTNRFPRTSAYRAAMEEESFAGQFSSTDGYLARVKSMLAGESTDNANVHVARLGGDLVALTETPNWLRIDPESLENRGTITYGDDLTAHHVTAHLRRDPETGDHWGYFTRFGRTTEYVLFRIPEGTTRREQVASVAVDRPAYMHSFALTAEYAVLVEPPLTTHPARFLLPGSGGFIDNYDWHPDRGTRFLVFRRDSGELVREATVPAFFTFHTANAFETAGENDDATALVVDLVAYDDDSAVTDLSIAALRGGDAGFPSGELRRYRLPLDGGDPAYDHLADDVEMPRFSPEVHTREYEHVFAQSTEMEGGNALVRVDAGDGTGDDAGVAERWEEAGVYSGEPIFVPHPDGTEEADGVVLSLCLDADAERSFLLVCDGELTELARAPLPHVVPFGFHGEYFRS